MKLRQVRYFMRGFFHVRPAPYGRDFYYWAKGSCVSAIIVILLIPLTMIGIGYWLGKAF